MAGGFCNSFSAARHVLDGAGIGDLFEPVNRAAVQLCREAIDKAAPHPQWIAGSISTCASDHDRRNLPLDEVLPSIVERAPDGLQLIVTMMHCRPEDTGPALAVARSCWDGDLAAYPNTGAYDAGGWNWKDAQTPEAFADHCTEWAAHGARIMGGCCGYGPRHIRAMSARLPRVRSGARS